MGILDTLFLKHETWIKYVKSFGCSDDIAEDFVQEMYIKIHNYIQKTNADLMYNENEINFFFVYVTLKNLYYDNLRQKKKVLIVAIENVELEDEDYSENNFENQNEKLKAWKKNLQSEIDRIKNYSKEKNNLIYIKFIYEKIFEEKISITKLSQDVGITYWSLRNTILIIKEQIKNGA
jgi:DNA-directed RNA polymerase specialized sigma24 family protein